MAHLSSDTETSWMPSTMPGSTLDHVKPSLFRRNSKPSSIHISPTEWSSDVLLENSSPNVIGKPNDILSNPTDMQDPATTPRPSLLPTPQNMSSQPRPIPQYAKPVDSPCFVHSQLDKSASLTEWLRNKQHAIVTRNGDVDVARSLQTPGGLLPSTLSSESEEEEFGESLTKQLAETAVSVREMSKQLGRARVHSDIQTVLIVTKARDNRLIKLTRELALYLMLKPRQDQKRGLVVYVPIFLCCFSHSYIPPDMLTANFAIRGALMPKASAHSIQISSFLFLVARHQAALQSPRQPLELRKTTFMVEMTASLGIGLVVCAVKPLSYLILLLRCVPCTMSLSILVDIGQLGGDGTVLFTSWLFQRIVPPVLSFALGSLGFLTNFDFADYHAVMDSALDSGIRVNLRMRFTCTVYRAVSYEEGTRRKAVKKGETGEILMRNVEKGGWEAFEGGWSGSHNLGDGKCNAKDKEIMCFTTRPTETFEVLNDLVVDRGPSPYVSLLELFGASACC
ncbi:hypothetical protein C0989_003228 [Termitomyces sp. Mn162]|nr:hypothetical protein C0989_003228 [Termitomyces sp. Mn162]